MYRILIILVISFMFSGCSLLKVATAPLQPVKNSIPQSVEKTHKILKCAGNLEVKEDGSIYCDKGFYSNETSFEQKERKLNWREKIAQFFTRASGYVFYGVILSIILSMMGLGAIVSSFWSAVFGVSNKAFRQVVSAIQKVKDNNPSLIQALESSTDEDVRKFIADYKQKNNIK